MSDFQPPGFYPAAGDPPNTTRYWNGTEWEGEPIAAGGQPIMLGQTASYPEESQAIMALIMALLGLTLCQLLCPLAWIFGQRELDAIDAGRRDPSKRDMAFASKIIGIVGTALMVIGLIFLLLFVVSLGAFAVGS